MKIPRLFALLIPLTLLALACGPTAVSDSGAPPAPVVVQTTPEPDTLPTKPPYVPPTPEPDTAPVKPVTPEPPPTPAPPLAHPEGIAGCKSVVAFRDVTEVAYQDWCTEQLFTLVSDTCRDQPTGAEQRQCGGDVVADYDSIIFRHGAAHCAGISYGDGEKEACLTQSGEDLGKAFGSLFEAWEKVRLGASGDAAVAKATDDVVACLEGKGFEDVDKGLLFPWQRLESPADHKAREARLTQQEKDLRLDLVEPSQDCAKQHGLFEAQEAAWSTELKRLHKEEPALATDLVREGLLEALRKPGVTVFLTGE